jgi:dihydrofolate reductase
MGSEPAVDLFLASAGNSACTKLGLVDALGLMIFPVVIGEGKRLFEGIDRLALKLADVKTVGDDGVVVEIYKARK